MPMRHLRSSNSYSNSGSVEKKSNHPDPNQPDPNQPDSNQPVKQSKPIPIEPTKVVLLYTNNFADTPLTKALATIKGMLPDACIIYPSNLEGNITAEFKDTPLDQVMKRVVEQCPGYDYLERDGCYYIGPADSPDLVTTKAFPTYADPKIIKEQLKPFAQTANITVNDNIHGIVATAGPRILNQIEANIRAGDPKPKTAIFNLIAIRGSIESFDAAGIDWGDPFIPLSGSGSLQASIGQKPQISGQVVSNVTQIIKAIKQKGTFDIRVEDTIIGDTGKETIIELPVSHYIELFWQDNPNSTYVYPYSRIELVKAETGSHLTAFPMPSSDILVDLDMQVADIKNPTSNVKTEGVTVFTRHIKTKKTVPNGVCIQVAQITSKNKETTEKKLPILGLIPFFGGERSESTQTVKTIFCVTVTVE